MNHLRALRVTRYTAVLNLRRLCTKVEKQEPLWANMNVEEFGSSRDKLKLIDVREPEELRYHGCFNGAINIPRMSMCVYLYGQIINYFIVIVGEVEEALQLTPEQFKLKYGHEQPDKSDEGILLYCLRGIRSHTAVTTAHQLGYTK